MKLNKTTFHILLLSVILICDKNIIAAETSVFCVDENRNMRWLDNGNIKTQGTWGSVIINTYFIYRYFIPTGGLSEISNLKLMCNQEHGNNYLYAQPGNLDSTTWGIFALSNNQIPEGHLIYQLALTSIT